MTARDLIEWILLGVGVAVEVVCVVGVLTMRDAFDRIHYAMAASTVGPIAIVAAVLVHESFNSGGINALAVGLFLLLFGPVVAHATVRAARARRFGQVEARPDEVEPA